MSEPEYQIEVSARIDLPGTPSVVKSFAFAKSQQFVATLIPETNAVLLFGLGKTRPSHIIDIAETPVDITRGYREYAYVACQGENSIAVIDQNKVIERIPLPSRPYSIVWNGGFGRRASRIMVACQGEHDATGEVHVINEEKLDIVNTLQVGSTPREMSLAHERKIVSVVNYEDDSITLIDQRGTQVLHTIATAGHPWTVSSSWANSNDMIIALQSGGVLQRMDASRSPPQLSGLTVIRKQDAQDENFFPYACLPIEQDHLWVVTDKGSETIALVLSRDTEFNQIGSFELEPATGSNGGLGQVAVATKGIPGSLYIASLKRKQLILLKISKVLRKPSETKR